MGIGNIDMDRDLGIREIGVRVWKFRGGVMVGEMGRN